MGLFDVFKVKKFKAEIDFLNKLIEEIGARDAVSVKRKIEEYRDEETQVSKKLEDLKWQLHDVERQLKSRQRELVVIDDDILFESFALYKPKFKFQTSDVYKRKLEYVREREKALIKSGEAASGDQTWAVNNSLAQGRKMVNDLIKLLLRSFNNECDYCVDNVTFNNIEASKNRIEKSFEACNRLGKIAQVSISERYKELKYEELYVAFEYMQKKEEEKEEAKIARAELREQQKLEREIREARERIAKERKHFSAAIKDYEAKLKSAVDEKERALIVKNLEEARAHFEDLTKEEKVIDYREQNAKAGYVYVISNIGAFGENVYKIGMTRRLEPMERVDELGDASVPFSFDVHAMVFSDNAPALEAKLHEHFHRSRINKMNDRKEFFRADINEIEKVLKENYDKIVDVVKEAPAEQYRESLLVRD